MSELENLRCRIDAIDKELIVVFEKEYKVYDIAKYKIANTFLY